MKNLVTILCLFLFSSILISGCGGGKSKSEDRKMNASLDSLITNMAACKEQNTNCPAYTKASEQIPAMAKDTANKNLVEDLFNGIAQSTSGARSAACAHAINFWVGNSDHYKNAAYGRIVLDALKKEKYDEKSYVGSTLGQLLSGWLVTDDQALLKDIHAAIKDNNTEKRGRKELIRLSGKESFAKPGLLDLLISLANDSKESEEIRVACLGVIWRVDEKSQAKKVEDLYIGFLSNAAPAIVGASLEGLGYMKSVNGFGKVLETIEKSGANEEYYSSSSRALNSYISFEAKEGIDTKKAFNLAVKMANNTNLKPYNRSYYILPIETFGGSEGKKALSKLEASTEKDIANPAKQALERLKNKK
ncbi:MAG: hypothetical protein HXX09_13885 [Bacteroidetes bacterium]|nr:hypothetical protein [Bacteroidota bacterium]